MKACVIDARHRLDPKTFVKHGADIHRCLDCGCIMADIAFQHDQYESPAYYTLSRKTVADVDEEWGFRWRHVLRRIRAAGDFSSVLDVGAGNGYFVRLAAGEFGFDATGIEISAQETRFAEEVLGVRLIHGDVAQHRRTYDVVTAFNVLEHVADPRAFLACLVNRMKPGGILVLTTPNPGCIHARVKGLQRWNMVDPPHHVNLLTRKALDALLKPHGLAIVRYETLSTYINFVRRFDTPNLTYRRLFFNALRAAGLGADHFLIARRVQAAA